MMPSEALRARLLVFMMVTQLQGNTLLIYTIKMLFILLNLLYLSFCTAQLMWNSSESVDMYRADLILYFLP